MLSLAVLIWIHYTMIPKEVDYLFANASTYYRRDTKLRYWGAARERVAHLCPRGENYLQRTEIFAKGGNECRKTFASSSVLRRHDRTPDTLPNDL
jgi:hypothetical protein